jgi:ABC-type phosphate transport system permease subunit
VQQNPQPFIINLPQQPAEHSSLADVVVGSLGITGLLVLTALVLGVVVAFVLVQWHRRHPPDRDHMPSVSQTPQ